MKILTDLKAFKKKNRPVILASGFFDGIHTGHKKVINEAVSRARALKGEAWMLTFDVHPMKVIKPDKSPLLLTSQEHKIKLLSDYQLQGCLVLPFTRSLSQLEPEEFVDFLTSGMPTLTEMHVGQNWRFGRHGKGTFKSLACYARKKGFKAVSARPVQRKYKPVSSTRIRKAIQKGDFKEAAAMLGRQYSILGVTIKGRGVGRSMNFPTANLDCRNEALPPFGVYAVKAEVSRKMYDGVLNYGLRPTFGKKKDAGAIIELHLLNFKGNLYGKEVEASFVEKLRNERVFRSKEALSEQIAKDIIFAEKILAKRR